MEDTIKTSRAAAASLRKTAKRLPFAIAASLYEYAGAFEEYAAQVEARRGQKASRRAKSPPAALPATGSNQRHRRSAKADRTRDPPSPE